MGSGYRDTLCWLTPGPGVVRERDDDLKHESLTHEEGAWIGWFECEGYMDGAYLLSLRLG